MRINNFSSTADRRWQRRYERIQQRKEDEAIRRERVEYESEMVKYEDTFRQLESFQTELLRQQEAELLRRQFEEEKRRLREELERQMFDVYERWMAQQYKTSPVYRIVIGDAQTEFAHEPDLKEGDSSALDTFIDGFFTPGA